MRTWEFLGEGGHTTGSATSASQTVQIRDDGDRTGILNVDFGTATTSTIVVQGRSNSNRKWQTIYSVPANTEGLFLINLMPLMRVTIVSNGSITSIGVTA